MIILSLLSLAVLHLPQHCQNAKPCVLSFQFHIPLSGCYPRADKLLSVRMFEMTFLFVTPTFQT
jgi:hypothetical protein